MRYLNLVLIFISLLSFEANAFNRKAVISISTDVDMSSSSSWTKLGRDEKDSIRILLGVLDKSPFARKIISASKKRANEMGKTLLDVIEGGDTSICDTTLVRRFSPSIPSQVAYQTTSKVFLNRNHNVMDGAMDLIHELTHFSYREAFNPYHHKFTLKDFIKSTVEGKGGEVDAYLVECKVMSQLAPEKVSSSSKCDKVKDPSSGKFSKYHGTMQFYKVGKVYNKYSDDLSKYGIHPSELPALSDDSPVFLSSAYGMPYPIAAYREYEVIMGRACKNDLKRIAIFKSKAGRTVASGVNKYTSAYKKLRKSYYARCLNFE